MKVLVTGVNGQLGGAVMAAAPSSVTATGADRQVLDLAKVDQLLPAVVNLAPDVIVHCAAYTAVDAAESDAAMAQRINAEAVGEIACASRELGARLIHVSTDFVFDGQGSHPYQPDDKPNPVSVYGRTKWEGEQHVLETLGHEAVILRTAWVYGPTGKNFLDTMLRLMNQRDVLSVVEDQVGTPTSTLNLADMIWRLVATPAVKGICHWTDAGVASWYDFACAIYELGRSYGLIERDVCIKPIATQDYPTPACRPAYSVLDKRKLRKALGFDGQHWRDALQAVLKARLNSPNK